MIIGIGNDLCAIERIAALYQRYGNAFLNKLFTQEEIATALRRTTPAPTLAKRFAAKEAFVKALGTGFGGGVGWKDVGVVQLPSGQPSLVVTGGAARQLAAKMPAGMTARLHLSLCDEPPLAQAFVVIEAV